MKNKIGPNLVAWGAALLPLACGLFYFSFLPVNYSFDGTVFSQFLRYALIKHDWLAMVQIHHLLYFPANYSIYRVLEALFDYRALEFFHLQLFSLLFAVLSLWLAERSLKRIGLAPVLRLLAVAAIAFSNSFWLHAVDAEVHMPGVFFALAGLFLLVFHDRHALTPTAAALCFALAAGFHLTNILIVAGAFLYLLQKRTPWRRLAHFLAAFFCFGLSLYLAYALLAHKPVLRTFYNIFFGADLYSGYHSTYFRVPGLATLATSLTGLQRALIARTGIVATLLSLAFLVLLALAGKATGRPDHGAFKRAMLFWFAPFFLFFSLWDSGNIEFKIHAIVPLLLIAFAALDNLKPFLANTAGIVLAASLFWFNFSDAILPANDIRQNTNYQVALAIQKQVPAQGKILISGTAPGYKFGKIYLPYFAWRDVLILDWLLGKGHSLTALEQRLQADVAAGRPLYALGEVIEENGGLKKLLAFHRVGADDYARFRARLRPRLVSMLPGGFRLYRLDLSRR